MTLEIEHLASYEGSVNGAPRKAEVFRKSSPNGAFSYRVCLEGPAGKAEEPSVPDERLARDVAQSHVQGISLASRINSEFRRAMEGLKNFMGPRQWNAVAHLAMGPDEGHFFVNKMRDLWEHIERCSKAPSQDALLDHAKVRLHYFSGGFDWWITELDPGDVDGPFGPQHQAFGFANLDDPLNAEYGYISLPELFEIGSVELDFHFQEQPMSVIKTRLGLPVIAPDKDVAPTP